ncbi:hypothetical protein DFJ63DRAFT_337488 [Scheffersomyces coipomensis]|uniref:uncharacterized protein n=1 Tax=Scheffersomyces coipomensis TaxID=1788519 RepID=UPI00315D4866
MSHIRQGHREEEHDTGSYLDPTFGQYPAFPSNGVGIDSETSEEVSNYLKSVREEAENDDLVHFAPRTNGTSGLKRKHESELDEKPVGVDSNWSKDLLSKFVTIKQDINRHHGIIANSVITTSLLPDTAAQCRKLVFENDPPQIERFFNSIDRGNIFKLLIYFTKWLSKSTNEHLSKWIWMTFLRIDNELEASECSIIRDLAKKALKLASKVPMEELDDNTSYTLDMIITLVGHYYGQKDLIY